MQTGRQCPKNWPSGLPEATRVLALLLTFLMAAPAASAQIARIPAPEPAVGNFFGGAVSLHGDHLLVGASGDSACGPNAGAAFLYGQAANGLWALEARLAPEDCEPEEYFGRAVRLEEGLAVVTSFVPSLFSTRSNAVYVFELDTSGQWMQTGKILAPADRDRGPFAASVALDDGRVLVTSAGDTAGGKFNGAGYVYEKNAAGRWVLTATLEVPHDARRGVFGASCTLDRGRAVISSSTYGLESPGSAYIFEESAGAWVQTARIDGVDDYFIPLDLDGERLLIGQTRDGDDHTGRAVIYERKGSSWARTAELKPDSPYPSGGFGSAVSISGDLAVVVGFDEQLKLEFNIDRVAFVFGRAPDGSWIQRRIVDVGEVYFGAAIDLEGDRLVIGQASEKEPGAVYMATVR